MAKSRSKTSSESNRPMRPALSPEARVSQLAAAAYDLAEQQLRDGTASAQVISYFLRKGSEEDKLKIEKLQEENRLLRAKTKAIDNEGEYKKLVEDAINAIRGYQGRGDSDEEYEY